MIVDAIVAISCSQLDERERGEGEEKRRERRREERGEEEEVYCCFFDTTIHPPGSNCLPLGDSRFANDKILLFQFGFGADGWLVPTESDERKTLTKPANNS